MSSRQQVTRVSAYGLVLQNEHILLCRISSHLPLDAGYWTLPGGGIDFGEDPVDAMVREVHEETGLAVRPLGIAGIDSFYADDTDRAFHGIRIIYHTELIGGGLRHEVDGTTDLCAWWSLEEARRLPLVDLVTVGLGMAFPKG
jgi:8-oxo-dGTP diphosphatase